MNADFLKAAGMVIGLLVSGPFIYACIKAAAFFGGMNSTIRGLQSAVDRLNETVDSLRTQLGNHGERLSATETEIGNLKRSAPVSFMAAQAAHGATR